MIKLLLILILTIGHVNAASMNYPCGRLKENENAQILLTSIRFNDKGKNDFLCHILDTEQAGRKGIKRCSRGLRMNLNATSNMFHKQMIKEIKTLVAFVDGYKDHATCMDGTFRYSLTEKDINALINWLFNSAFKPGG